MFFKKKRSPVGLVTGVSIAAIGAAASPAMAQTTESGRITDEIVVTAEKREASIQDVPIAISAFDEGRLERLQLNDAQDLVQAIPNFNASKSNFNGNNITIRGVGTKVVATSGDAAVGIHINSAPSSSVGLFEGEFFDIGRVEVLRGPQGTLYGRNASSGVLNLITAKPQVQEWSGKLEGTYGNFNTYKVNGYVNMPIGDSFALRLAGFSTQRDGFTDDINTGQDVDGRDMQGFRLSAFAELSPDADVTLMVQVFEEDSNRSRIGKQLCTTDNRGWPFSQGCLPQNVTNAFGVLNTSSTLGGLGTLIFPNFDPDGAGPLQATLASPLVNGGNLGFGGLNPADYRKVALAFQPNHQSDEFVATLEFNYDFGPVTFTSLTSLTQVQTLSNVDYNQVRLGSNFNPTIFNPTVAYTGLRTGTKSTLATFDESRAEAESITQELRLTSDLDGPINYTIGYISIDTESRGDYQVISNSLEILNQGLGIPASFNQSFFSSLTDPYRLDASALFGEVYVTPTDDLKLTLGLRRTSDDKSVSDRQTLLQGVPRDNVPFNTRSASFDETTGRFTVDYSSQLPFTDETNWYAAYAKGYKGGGINPPIDPALFVGVARTFDPEFIDSYEIGMKNVLADGRMTANLAGFYYEYNGYQITRIVNRTSVNANIDATVKGLELETVWEPVDRLVFDLNVGWLNTEITDSLGGLVDPINVTNNNAAYTNVSDALRWIGGLEFTAAGAFVGRNTTGTPAAAGNTIRQPTLNDLGGANGMAVAAAAGQVLALNTPTFSTVAQCIVPLTAVAALPSPALAPFLCQLARGFGGDPLAGADGIRRRLEGNELPNSPEWTVSFGAQYTVPLGNWAATARADYYYQAESFARIFNAANDALESYSQVNASLRFDHEEAGLYASLFVKNATDEDVITDLYLTDQSSGLFTNAFLLEPRTYGITVGKRW